MEELRGNWLVAISVHTSVISRWFKQHRRQQLMRRSSWMIFFDPQTHQPINAGLAAAAAHGDLCWTWIPTNSFSHPVFYPDGCCCCWYWWWEGKRGSSLCFELERLSPTPPPLTCSHAAVCSTYIKSKLKLQLWIVWWLKPEKRPGAKSRFDSIKWTKWIYWAWNWVSGGYFFFQACLPFYSTIIFSLL